MVRFPIDLRHYLAHNHSMKIAIIGSGISGLGAAHLLAPNHDITIFEKNAYIGGHSRTIDVATGNAATPVDTGFIVFNDRNYPNLLGLFEQLGVPYEKSDMSFGVSIEEGWLEYSSSGMFAQISNLARPQFWGMLGQILRFNKQAQAYIEADTEITLGQCLEELGMGEWFRNYYLLAMGAAIWSCSVETIMDFPAKTYLRFFKNHGLLTVFNQPQWYTVTGGSREYTKRLTAKIRDKIHLNHAVKTVRQNGEILTVTDVHGQEEQFDHVIFASHADETLAMLAGVTKAETDILSQFRYQENKIIVHNDLSFMPKNRKCWASWVYLNEGRMDNKDVVSLSYWMNNLQNLDHNHPIIVTLNPGRRPKEESIMDEHTFTHPIFDLAAVKAQEKVETIQGKRNIWFCGAYQRYGFHEDGLLSAVNVAKKLGAEIPWE